MELTNRRESVESSQTGVPDEKKWKDGKYRGLFREFVQETSAAGINKVFSTKHIYIRCSWVILCFVCYGLTIYHSYQALAKFMRNPVSTTVDITVESNVTFPAVTICNLNKFRSNILKQRLPQLHKVIMYYQGNQSELQNKNQIAADTDGRKNIHMQNVFTRSGIKNTKVEAGLVASREILNKLILQASSNYSYKELENAGHQFENFIADCKWMGVACNTGHFRKYWKQLWNWKYGNCYTFNFGLDSKGSTPLPLLRTNKAGPDFGLQLDIFLEQDEYIPQLSEEAGVKVVVDHPRYQPFPFNEGVVVPPGTVASIALRKEVIERVDQFGNKSCVEDTTETENIYSKDHSTVYTVQSCLDTCLVTHQQKLCNCTEVHYPVQGKKCLTKEEDLCVSAVDEKYQSNGYGCIEGCPQRCRHISYRTTISHSQISYKHKDTIRSNLNNSKTSQLFSNPKNKGDVMQDFLRIKIYFEALNLVHIHQDFSYSWSDFLSDVGGQIGLWIGLCVISVAEFGDLLLSFIMLTFSKQNRVV